MNEREFEERLAQLALPEAPAGIRARVLAGARRRQRSRALRRAWRWSVAVAVGLLICVNLLVGRVQERELAMLLGRRPTIERPLQTRNLAYQFRERQRLLMTISNGAPGNGLKEGWLQ